jgi:toxin ParE1/3/4
MHKIIRSVKALEDLDGIFDFVAASSPQNAERLIRLFQSQFEVLAKHPEMGRLRPELMERMRSWNLYRFVIFYFPGAQGIEIVRVLHSSMDLNAKHFPAH